MSKQTEMLSSPWNLGTESLIEQLLSSLQGLTSGEAQVRLGQVGRNALTSREKSTPFLLFLSQLKNPLTLILVFAAIISMVTGDWVDATIVLAILFASAVLGFMQEYRASNAMEKLRSQLTIKTNALRDGVCRSIPVEEVVPGDVVLLSAGSIIPADGIVIQAEDFFVNQAVLTGESFPVEKKIGPVPVDANLTARTNCVFMGTNVRSGSARVLIFQTGKQTAYGQIADRLAVRPPETEFQRGIRKFGEMLSRVMIVLVLIVLAANVYLHKPVIDSLLFAVALAVGIAPEMLPAIINVTLSVGAQTMAKRGVIVRKLEAIENLGSMDVLCTDKTGTLTLGVVQLDGALDVEGHPSDDVFRLAYLNAQFQTGLDNPMDEAILAKSKPDIGHFIKTEEVPYDFVRKRMSVVVQDTASSSQACTIITKGALDKVLDICPTMWSNERRVPLNAASLDSVQKRFAQWSDQGYRVLGIATKEVSSPARYTAEAEVDMTFAGFLLFFDPPKPDARQTIQDLRTLGVQLKLITGDNRRVTQHIAQVTGMPASDIITGSEMNQISDEALGRRAVEVNLFAEVDPNQKERIISALRKTGHVVGFMGDGINDAPALHSADVSISVNNAVDVAKEAADFVLLDQSLDVLRGGIEEGRKTFSNTLKYISYTESANFGNMVSMAIISPFLTFLPLLPKQILLNNFMSDIPAMTIAVDEVDPEMVTRPKRWNVDFIRTFMVVFGLLSSAFDLLTIGLLLWVLKLNPDQFRTGWFIESLLTELFVFLVIRTNRPFFRSRPGRWLLRSTLAVAVISLAMPYLPFVQTAFNLAPLSPVLMILLLAITGLYVLVNEIAKRIFYRRVKVN